MDKVSREPFKQILLFSFLVLLLWSIFGPVQLGGRTAYVIITGNSMAPDFAAGDLIITRKRLSYDVNDRVVYQHPKVGHVFHRIIDRDKDGFLLKGDSNDWIDSYRPSQLDIIGGYWFDIPGGGTVVRILREPLIFTLFALIIVIITGSIFLFKTDTKIRKRKFRGKIDMDRFQISLSHQTRQDLLLLLGVIAIAALILGVIAFSRPITQLVSEELIYQHQGEFSYTAPDQAGIYDSNRIFTGDPIFTRLNCVLELQYHYRYSVLGDVDLNDDTFSGTYQIVAQVRDIDGWNRTIELIPETEFSGTHFAAWTLLDVCQAQSLLIEKVQKTRIDNRSYNLLVYPRVKVFGSVEGVTVEDIHAPEISFQLDNEKMRLQPGIEGLELDQSGSLMAFHEVNNVLLIFGKELSVLSARRIALIALGITLLGAVYPVWLMITEKKTALGSRIRLLYEELLVDVEMDSLIIKGSQVVSVEAFRDLVKMAQRYGAMILHETDGRLHRYTVQDENILYQYAVEETPVEEE